jgi:hypothetical protein
MANWQNVIRLQPEWGQAKSGEISVASMAAVIAKKLRALSKSGRHLDDHREELEDLIDEFEDLSRDPMAVDDDLDGLMGQLYDWGDRRLDNDWNGKKLCWIDTISGRL